MDEKTVYVLGAGFTRAFRPTAPLLVGDFEIPSLVEKFKGFRYASALLQEALDDPGLGARARENRLVDLERLLTRLSGMPYDGAEARLEIGLLETSLRKTLVRKLVDARQYVAEPVLLRAFARSVLVHEASIVTFNYDDVVDEALHKEATKSEMLPSWHPDGGYGFFCRTSRVCVADFPSNMDQCKTLVLKLHGSINWRSRLGERRPRGPTELLHHEEWVSRMPQNAPHPIELVEAHLEPEPFVVPPVLVKAELSLHPVLHSVWEGAYKKLIEASRVVFIGYSLPVTDMASRTLFRETLSNRHRPAVEVVSLANGAKQKALVRRTYGSLFPWLSETAFNFGGAAQWVTDNCDEVPAEPNDAAGTNS